MRSKVFILLVVLCSLGSAVFAQRPPSDPRWQSVPIDTSRTVFVDEGGQLRAAQKAIDANIVKVEGKSFPKALALTTGPATNAISSPQSSCCTPGETRKRDVLFFKQYTGKNENKNKQYGPYNMVEGTNKCWVISAYQRVEMSAAGKFGVNVSHQPAGFHLNQSSTYTNEYQNIRSYLLTLKLPKNVEATIDAKLNEFVKNYTTFSQTIDTSHAIVQQSVTLWGAGIGNGRSWYEGYVNITETCCPPEVRDAQALRVTLKAWVDDTAKKYKTYVSPYEPAYDIRPVN